MPKQMSKSKKKNTPIYLYKYRNIIIGAMVGMVVIATLVFVIMKDSIMNVDTDDTTNVDIENNAIDMDLLREMNAKIESNEQIIYIAPEDLYIDDNVVISVTSHIENQIHGQGIRFDYRNKSLEEIEITVTPVEDSESLKTNKTTVEPGTIGTHVLYIGMDAEPFKEGTYTFTVTVGENSYVTESITIKAK